jgi:hypothetical protein
VLTIQRAKALQGKLVLPPSPDLFCVAAFASIALERPVRIHPINGSPAIKSFAELLNGHAAITWEDDACLIDPTIATSATEFLFANDALPWRDLVVFMALGTQKPVMFKSATAKRIEAWRAQAARTGFSLDLIEKDGLRGLKLLPPSSGDPVGAPIGENDIHAFLGLMLGLHAKRSFQADYTPSTPVRSLVKAFGFDLSVKRDQGGVEKDPLVRRMRLQAGQRLSSQDQLFTITADFSCSQPNGLVDILLPGDEVLFGLFTAAKSLVHKGSLVIDNAPLDPWATPIISLLRKMGSKPSQQETHQTAFGAAGMVSIQKFDLTGQKTECTPLYQYLPHLPAMTMVTAFAEGQSIFRRLDDLRLSDPDGIQQLEACLVQMRAKFGDMPDGFVLQGTHDYDGFDLIEPLPAALAAAFALAGLCCMGSTTVNDDRIVERWPLFHEWLGKLCEFRT